MNIHNQEFSIIKEKRNPEYRDINIFVISHEEKLYDIYCDKWNGEPDEDGEIKITGIIII